MNEMNNMTVLKFSTNSLGTPVRGKSLMVESISVFYKKLCEICEKIKKNIVRC